MNTNIEIEFKTFITKEKYDELIKQFNLQDNIFSQTNHYFDTDSFDLQNNNTVLRIRQKPSGYGFKLTSKGIGPRGAFETHIILKDNQALDMIKNGFDASIINLNGFVKKQAELTTHRASTAYLDGKLFFDHSEYYGKEDFEIEYEATSYDRGKKQFEKLLKTYNVPFTESTSKTKRALNNKK